MAATATSRGSSARINARGVPIVSIAICFVIGMLTFLPFPDWYGLVGLITSATVIMYAMAPLALAGLRKHDPDRERQVQAAGRAVLCPLAFALANIIVYVSGYSTLFWLDVFIAVGFVFFGLYQATQPRRPADDPELALRVVDPALARRAAGHLLARPLRRLATQGVRPDPVATQRIGNWWDLLVVAAMSLAIYYWATQQRPASRRRCRRQWPRSRPRRRGRPIAPAPAELAPIE